MSDLDHQAAGVTPEAVAAATAHASGWADVTSLLGSQSAVAQVTLKPALPDTNYTVNAWLTGGAGLLASAQISGTPTKVSGSRVDVTVQNAGVLTIGPIRVLVLATRD